MSSTSSSPTTGGVGEVARYAAAVRNALADLPAPDRDDLLQDLESHLDEVAADSGGPLTERLGYPDEYAAELRASAGLPEFGGSPWKRDGLHGTVDVVLAAVADDVRSVSTVLRPALLPGWWILRGLLVGGFLSTYGLRPFSYVLPAMVVVFGTVLLIALLTAVASIAVGRRAPRAPWVVRALVVTGNVAVSAFVAYVAFIIGTFVV